MTEVSDSLVIIPTYNERENIEKVLQIVFSLPKDFHVLVVDDSSPDGTAELVRHLMETWPGKLFLESREGKLGLGTAYIHGFKWALKRDYGFIFEMDADLSHNPEDLVRLYRECAEKGYDLAIGSRYIDGVNVVNWPMGRVLMSYFASIYVRMITGMPIHDTTAGFKCYRREVLEAIELDSISFTGYAFQIEMKFTAWKMGFKISEVSIVFTDRSEGESKMSSGIFKEAVWGVIKLRWRSILNPKRYQKSS
ncbi:MAG: polyprenol monophosphomannose synthase [Bacteroidales bacterium]